ncbi:MAG TPA: hypothetical protein VJL88_08300 [Nitrospira sp.]|nr:hypothetical protein [Nitrospira sp.]
MPFEQQGSEGKEVTTSSGLQYIDLTIGTGATAQAGQTVTVHYSGWLENGKNSTVPSIEANHSLFLSAPDASSRDGMRVSKA